MNSIDDLSPTFRFKQFVLTDRHCGMKIGTDGVLIGSWATLGVTNGTVADVGAGCGLISLMMAQRFPDTTINAIEIEQGAVADIRHNVTSSKWADRIKIFEGDFQSFDSKVDLIVSNPPFFNNGESSPDGSRALARHSNDLSPLSLIKFASDHLNESGRLAMIFPVEQLQSVEYCAVVNRLEIARICIVANSPSKQPRRTMIELIKTTEPCPTVREYMTIRNSDNSYSTEYINLTKDFYLNIDK